MPLRDFKCEACGRTQEALVRRPEDETELRCDGCGGAALTRQLSAPARSAGGCGDGGGGGGSSGFG